MGNVFWRGDLLRMEENDAEADRYRHANPSIKPGRKSRVIPSRLAGDLIDTPLSAAEIARLPARLRWRLWAGEIGHGVSGFTPVRRDDARHGARSWLRWVSDLKPGDPVIYDHRAGRVNRVAVQVEGLDEPSISISIDGFADRFLAGPTDLAPPPRGKRA